MNITLENLLDLAEQQARLVLLEVKHKGLMPSWMLVNGSGEVEVIGTPWRNDTEKLATELMLREHMAEHGTVMYSFLCEAWVAHAPEGYKPGDPLIAPRFNPDAYEAVQVIACTASQTKRRSWEIIRDSKGQITELREEDYADRLEAGSGGWIDSLLR